jgi:5-methylcytosine-specific restriction endonuclease McrA
MTRDEVFARDEYRCVYCGQIWPADELSVDHVQARSRGGDRSGGNLVTACRACNVLKGRRRVAEYLADNPHAHANFRRYAVHVWKRHLRALEEEIEHPVKRQRSKLQGPKTHD